MGDAGFFRGTSTEQDSRFSNKEKKLLSKMKFSPELDKKVDFSSIKIDAIKPWITARFVAYTLYTLPA
eukprot:m.137201 g.137201  ORF g.137201 m.137201 type:complete len:68 (+) comp17582_c0_seq1:168-371(+)